MQLDQLVVKMREAAGPRVWGAAVKLARGGAVLGVSNDGEEVRLKVKGSKALPHEVFLWPDDADWGCDCGQPVDACVHTAAAAIAMNQKLLQVDADGAAEETQYKVRIRYAFTTENRGLACKREIVHATGKVEPMTKVLAKTNLIAEQRDGLAETLLVLYPKGPIPPDHLRRLIAILDSKSLASLDGKPIKLSKKPVLFDIRVEDEGEGFRVGLFRPSGVQQLVRGAAVMRGTLRPTSHGDLTPDQRKMLVSGVSFSPDEVGLLVGEYLPKLRARIPVKVVTKRLPDADSLKPFVEVKLTERAGGLEVKAAVVYGDPPVGRITLGNTMERLSDDVVPARDLVLERLASRAYREATGMTVGIPRILPPAEAVEFLSTKLPKHEGLVRGRVSADRFQVHTSPLTPSLEIERAQDELAIDRPWGPDLEEAAWTLDVVFEAAGKQADPTTVLEAWRTGRSLVPLLDGGWAPLPKDWLKAHGALLMELLEARDASNRVGRQATAALIELMEDTSGEVPDDLARVRTFLEGGEGLPEAKQPDTLHADLRPYQLVGFQWLAFLRQMGLHGVLADDMGLGKTVQALGGIAATEGPHLVVAPTSVLPNWEREANRFVPGAKVCLYHGPNRTLDPDADIILTSYALLRIDAELLHSKRWTYAILDEAQAIKNARSKTALAAYGIVAKHRLALTGTPVENRLEELWSLFRFLMPGLLGSVASFRDGFVKPIEGGDGLARTRLRNRVKPYVMRRLKQQVATELPALTEIVIRCEMDKEQRRVYDTVRLIARKEVQEALAERGRPSTMAVLEALLRMRQACCDPHLLPGDLGSQVGSTKLDKMEELLIDLVPDNHKLLIFSQWTGLLDRVEPRLKGLDIDWVRLDGTTKNRQAVIDKFQSDDGPPVFLLSLKAGGTGLNLTAADYVLHLDPWWNPAVERQATDRAHRIGQDKPVVSCRLIAESSVEERILELQDAKRDLADAALGTEGGIVSSLTADELRGLFEEVVG